MAKKLWCGILAVLVIFVSASCGGAQGKAGTPPIPTVKVSHGRIVSDLTWYLPTEAYPKVKTKVGAKMAAHGWTFNDTDHTALIKGQPAFGVYVKAGDYVTVSDKDGNFELPALSRPPKTIAFYHQMDDPAPLTVANYADLSPIASPPTVFRYQRDFKGPVGMTPGDSAPKTREGEKNDDGTNDDGNDDTGDGDEDGTGNSCSTGHCGEGASPTCCLDYNGTGGTSDGRHSGWYHYVEFPFSTCYDWVLAGPCANEGAITGTGPSCIDNHHGRLCQQLDDNALKLTASATEVQTGGSVTLTVTNKTRADTTPLNLTGSGADDIGSLEKGDGFAADTGSGASVTLAHYKEQALNIGGCPGISRFTHFDDRTATYKAPSSLPDGTDEITVTITAAGTNEQSVTIKVKKKKGHDQGGN